MYYTHNSDVGSNVKPKAIYNSRSNCVDTCITNCLHVPTQVDISNLQQTTAIVYS